MNKRSLSAVALFLALIGSQAQAITVEQLQAQREAVIEAGTPHLKAIDFDNVYNLAALASYMDNNLNWRVDYGELSKMIRAIDPSYYELDHSVRLERVKQAHRNLVSVYWDNPALNSSHGKVLAAAYPDIFYRGFWK